MRRYELPQPGPLIHVNVKKLGNIPDSSGWRFVGCWQGNWDRQTTPGKPCNKCGNELMKHAFVHTVINDYSRIAYAEVHDDETALIPGAVLIRAVDWFAARGIAIEPVVSDNGSTYRSHLWTDVCGQLGITVTKTRPRRPQTNGKIERFHRTMTDSWPDLRPLLHIKVPTMECPDRLDPLLQSPQTPLSQRELAPSPALHQRPQPTHLGSTV